MQKTFTDRMTAPQLAAQIRMLRKWTAILARYARAQLAVEDLQASGKATAAKRADALAELAVATVSMKEVLKQIDKERPLMDYVRELSTQTR